MRDSVFQCFPARNLLYTLQRKKAPPPAMISKRRLLLLLIIHLASTIVVGSVVEEKDGRISMMRGGRTGSIESQRRSLQQDRRLCSTSTTVSTATTATGFLDMEGVCFDLLGATEVSLLESLTDSFSSLVSQATSFSSSSSPLTSDALNSFLSILTSSFQGGDIAENLRGGSFTVNLADRTTQIKPGFCMGDFPASEILDSSTSNNNFRRRKQYFSDSLCSSLPLQRSDDDDNVADWSVLSFAMPVPAGVCGFMDPTTLLQGCLAVSMCNDIPSIAVAINGATTACLASTTGVLAIGSDIMDESIGSLSMGFSRDNAFVIDFPVYDGNSLDIQQYRATPTFFHSALLDLDAPGIFLDDESATLLSDAFRLKGMGTVALDFVVENDANGQLDPVDVQELDDIQSILQSGTSNIYSAVKGITVTTMMKGALDLRLAMPGDLQTIFPSINLHMSESSLVVSNGKFEMTRSSSSSSDEKLVTTLNPGLYAHAPAFSLGADVIQSVLDYVLNIAGTVMDIGGNFLPGLITSNDIRDSLDIGNAVTDDFGIGITINTDRSGFQFSLPFLLDDLGSLDINCYVQYNDLGGSIAEFRCETRANDGITQAFQAIAHPLVDGSLLWLVYEVENGVVQLGKVIGAAVVNTIDFLLDDGAASVFSRSNMAKTVNLIEAGLLDLSGDIADVTVNFATGIGSAILNPTLMLVTESEMVVQKVIGNGKTAIQAAMDIYEDASRLFDEIVGELEGLFHCAFGSIKALKEGKLSASTVTTCNPFVEIEDAVKQTADAVKSLFVESFEAVQDFFEDVGDVFYNTDQRTFYEDIEGKTDQFGCQRQTVMREETSNILVIIPVKTEVKVIGEVSNESCIRARVEEVQKADAEFRDQDLELKYQSVQSAEQQYAPALAVEKVLLGDAGIYLFAAALHLECTSMWNHDSNSGSSSATMMERDDDDMMLLDMTCSALSLEQDGSISETKLIKATDSDYIHRFGSDTPKEIHDLSGRLAKQVWDKILLLA